MVLALAAASISVPALLTLNVPPSSTFLNQAAAVIGWGAFLTSLASSQRYPRIPFCSALGVLLVCLGAVGLAALVSQRVGALPVSVSTSASCTVAAAMLSVMVGAGAAQGRDGLAAFRALCVGLIVAGVLSAAIGAVQVFTPQLTDGALISPSSSEGRASGNLRQPNHLSSLLLWSSVAVVWLMEAGRLRRVWGVVLLLGFVLVVVLAASRTGMLGVALLALWGLLDRRLSRSTRSILPLMAVAYVVFFAGLTWWAHTSGQVFGGEARLLESADSPNSRRYIWANALSLIASHPWWGVGFGEFNFAWSLTPFPNRPTAFFDHTHNLPLQLAVELGVPLATIVMAGLVWALWRAFVVSHRAPMPQALMLRAAFMMTLTIALHSLLEYPLWYAYFLMPAAFTLGLCLGADANARPSTSVVEQHSNSTGRLRPLLLAAVLMAVGGMLSVADYLRVAAIFSADEDAAPLAERIEAGKRSVLFAHHAHYAEATTAEPPARALPSFTIATHYLLDTRLMMAWARALHESGDTERARYLAARLREFRNPDSVPFFAPCDEPDRLDVRTPFQCFPPTKNFSFEDFR